MTEQYITLRGHHVEHLAETYFRKMNPVKVDAQAVRAAYSRSDENFYSKLEIDYGKSKPIKSAISSFFGEDYEDFMDGLVLDLEALIFINPELRIKIDFGLDSLCQMCPNKVCKGESSPDNDEQDSLALREFGLTAGENYTSGEIMEKIIEWQRKNDAPSPRQRKLAVDYGRSWEYKKNIYQKIEVS